jgi:hypothetical protein
MGAPVSIRRPRRHAPIAVQELSELLEDYGRARADRAGMHMRAKRR